MQAMSPTHTAAVDAGVLRVHALSAPMLRTVTAEGETSGPLPPSLSAIAERPVFAAAYSGNRYAEVDLCAGFSRWHGPKSLVFVRRALSRCGFDGPTTGSLLKDMKSVQADSPHYYR